MKVRNIRAFGEFWSDRKFLLSRVKFLVLADEIARLAGELDRPPRVLDAGIGRCRLQRLFQLRYPEISVAWHGLDLLETRLRIRLDVEGIRRVRGEINALPYRDGAFDAVVCCWVLQHLRDPEGAVRELTRVLGPRGRLLLAVPNGPQPFKAIRERWHPRRVAREIERGRQYSYNPQIQFYNLPRVRRIAREAGAEPLRWQGIGFATGGPLKFLENHEWYYRLNLWLGARIPRWTKNLVCVAEERPTPGRPPGGTARPPSRPDDGGPNRPIAPS